MRHKSSHQRQHVHMQIHRHTKDNMYVCSSKMREKPITKTNTALDPHKTVISQGLTHKCYALSLPQ